MAKTFIKYLTFIFSICIIFGRTTLAQSYFEEIVLQADTNVYTTTKHSILYQNQKLFFFKVKDIQEVCELTLFAKAPETITSIRLMPSPDFTVQDSIQFIGQKYARGRIKFNDLTNTQFARFVFEVTLQSGEQRIEEVKIYPYFETKVMPVEERIVLYEGEERIIDLAATNADNILLEGGWSQARNMEYRFSRLQHKLQVEVRPTNTGADDLMLKFKTIKPYLDDYNQLSYEVKPIVLRFTTLPSRINYLNLDKTEFFYDPQFNSSIEVQLDYSKMLSIKRTYRIESQQEPGGKLIAELFTQSDVGNNNKILAILRPYALHKIADGYLYVKDGDVTKFVTNFNIIQKPEIEKVSLLRDGEDWTTNLSVFAGEKIEVKVEGTGLLKAELLFDIGRLNFIQDTTRRSEQVAFFYLKIPVDIAKKKVSLAMNRNTTRFELLVREHQVPRDFDFVYISYDEGKHALTDARFNKPILKREPVRDINFLFDGNGIDTKNKIYGKQYLTIEIKLFNAAKDLIEIQKIDNIIICPGESSPRYPFYELKDCKKIGLNLNEYLLHKTYDLDGWSQIEVTVKHMEGRYTVPGYQRKLTIIKERLVLLDMQVSFPAGLLVKRSGETGIGRFTGISTAFLAQLSFYDRQKIGKVKPYKVGVGLIALDIFNVNNTQRDLGIVVLGSLLPVRNSRFSFPVYAGSGYLIQSNRWFFVFGPGIQFNF